jgi:hypothetical protein
MEGDGQLNCDLFLCEQDIHNLARKLIEKMKMMLNLLRCGSKKVRSMFSSSKDLAYRSMMAFLAKMCLL